MGAGSSGQKRRAAVIESGSEEEEEDDDNLEEEEEEEEVAGGTYYVVEDVLGVRTAGSGGREFLVRWQDYEGPDTWEPEDNLRPSLVREFMESQEEEAELPSAAPATAPAAAPATAPAAAPAAAPGAVPTTEPTGRRTGGGKSKKRQAGSSDVQPRAAPAAAQLSVPKLVVGARMEVQACSEDCDFVCSDPRCLWEACTVLADHGAVCDVCITEDEDVCKDVRRCKVRPAARAAGKRTAVAAAQQAAAPKQARPAPAPPNLPPPAPAPASPPPPLPAPPPPAKRKTTGDKPPAATRKSARRR